MSPAMPPAIVVQGFVHDSEDVDVEVVEASVVTSSKATGEMAKPLQISKPVQISKPCVHTLVSVDEAGSRFAFQSAITIQSDLQSKACRERWVNEVQPHRKRDSWDWG